MNTDRSWMVPLTGLAFVVLVIVGFTISGEPPTASEDPAQEIVDFYVDKEGSQFASALMTTIAGTLFVFFGGYLRRVLRDAEGQAGFLSAVAFAGVIVFALGLALDSTLTFALADTAGEIDPTATQALMALWNNDFLPFAMGLQIFLVAAGISIVRTRALPRWIGWIAILIGVLAVTPVGFFALLAAGLLVALMSVMLAMRARRPAAGPAAPA